MDINIQNTKIELIQWLTTLEDSSVIKKILELKQNETSNCWKKISDAEKKSIELGIKDADMGKLNPNSEAKKIYGKWL
jgi:hypothetical protein